MRSFFIKLFSNFSYTEISNKLILILPKIVVAAVLAIIFFILWKILKKFLSIFFKKAPIDKTVQNFVFIIIKNVIIIIGIVTALSQLGVNTGSILASLGVAGLTIGFAAKDALSNIISGVFIFWDRPFVIGDLIEINGQYGQVEEITMRSTRVSTVDGKMLAIPNTQIVNSMVASYTNFPHLRLDINFTVAVSESLDKIRNLVFGIVKDDEAYLSIPKPEIVLNSINDYNIELIFRVWIKNEKDHIILRFRLREQILQQLIHAKVNMPYETLDIHISKTEA